MVEKLYLCTGNTGYELQNIDTRPPKKQKFKNKNEKMSKQKQLQKSTQYDVWRLKAER